MLFIGNCVDGSLHSTVQLRSRAQNLIVPTHVILYAYFEMTDYFLDNMWLPSSFEPVHPSAFSEAKIHDRISTLLTQGAPYPNEKLLGPILAASKNRQENI